jgi:uncharacterized FlaG/YvyC family protein
MQLTNVQVLNALQSLNSLSQNKLPIRLAWKVTTAVRSLQEFAKSLDEPMQEIRTRHALRDEAGNLVEAVDEKGEKVPNTIQIPNDKIVSVNQEMNDLLSIIVEVNNVEFALSDFPESLELEPAVLTGLTPLIKDEPVQELKLVQ